MRSYRAKGIKSNVTIIKMTIAELMGFNEKELANVKPKKTKNLIKVKEIDRSIGLNKKSISKVYPIKSHIHNDRISKNLNTSSQALKSINSSSINSRKSASFSDTDLSVGMESIELPSGFGLIQQRYLNDMLVNENTSFESTNPHPQRRIMPRERTNKRKQGSNLDKFSQQRQFVTIKVNRENEPLGGEFQAPLNLHQQCKNQNTRTERVISIQNFRTKRQNSKY